MQSHESHGGEVLSQAFQSRGSTYDKFLYFRAIIIRAIALAWRDPEFKEEFIAHPKKALLKYFDYAFPFDLDLRIDDKNAKFTPTLNAGWTVYLPNLLEMKLPPQPDPDECDPMKRALAEAQALAEYNATHLTMLIPRTLKK